MIAYSNLLKYNTRSFTLYNVLSGEKYSINAKVKDLDNMIKELFAAKYSKNSKMDTDEIFYNKYRNINSLLINIVLLLSEKYVHYL